MAVLMNPSEPVPAGKYLAEIVRSETKTARSGSGKYLELQLQVLEGLWRGRKLWARLNIEHANPVAVQTAQSVLAAICRAVGVLAPKDTKELHNRPLTVTVRCCHKQGLGIVSEICGYAPCQQMAVCRR